MECALGQGFHPVFKLQNVRNPFLLPLCFMLFDEVFVWDHTNRWDYFDCRNTSEPRTPNAESVR